MNNKYKLVALFGEAGSGKDYILWHLMHTDWGKENLHRIISCTTRPPRENEKDGVAYHFKSTPSDFFSFPLVECACFREWWYGTSLDDFNADKINIGVFNIKGIKQILDNTQIKCLPIHIKTIPQIRLMRQLNREDNPDCTEIARRFLSDKRDFLNLNFTYKVVENNTDEVQPIIQEIISLITDWTMEEK